MHNLAHPTTQVRRVHAAQIGWFSAACAWVLSACSASPGNVGVFDRQSPASGSTSAGAGAGAGGHPAQQPTVVAGVAAPALNSPQAGSTAGSTPPRAGSGASSAMMPVTSIMLDDTGSNNPAGLSPAEVTKLTAGGPPAELKLLYPYDGTVFPSGTIAPLVMWTGNPAPDAVYLHMKSLAFEYKGVLAPATDGALYLPAGNTFTGNLANLNNVFDAEANKQLAIPQKVWDAAAEHSLGRADTFLLEVTERVNGEIHGPVSSHITIARGALHGSIYYDTCVSQNRTDASVLDILSGFGAQVMRIPRGGHAEPISNSSQCVGCHSVSARGSRLVAQRAAALADANAIVAGQPPVYAWSTPLGSDGKPDASTATQFGTMGSFGALYPDGSKYLAPAGDAGILPQFALKVSPLSASALFDTTTGMVVADTGIPASASMPMFSPDGTVLVFNDRMLSDAHGLAVMNYDTHSHKASNYKTLQQLEPTGNNRPGWPFMLPDNRAVIFVQTASPDFTSGQADPPGGIGTVLKNKPTYPSDLYIADVATGKTTLLAKAMGFNSPADVATDTTYLPVELDLHRNYFPTVSPVASGGYFWVFFDSTRHFGSLGGTRAVWGAAIDIHPDGSYTSDPSHPPFYVPGQEFVNTSHFRAFAALDPCKPDGSQCETGVDCCSGRCSASACSQAPPPEKMTCAQRDERCSTVADCCDSSNYCINGFCAFVELL
jgi:hypothetical protein